jgi:hypothetical protein
MRWCSTRHGYRCCVRSLTRHRSRE